MLNNIARIFLKKSRFLTLVCSLCVLISCTLLVLMLQLVHNSKESYKQSIKDAFGDCDIALTQKDYRPFSEEIINAISKIEGIEDVNSGHWDYIDMNTTKDFDKTLSVYTVGVVDGKLNKGRYKYNSLVSGNSIVINENLAKSFGLDIGDNIYAGNYEFKITEILYEDNFTFQNMDMAIMEQGKLCELSGQSNCSNYVLIKRNKDYYVNDIIDKIKPLSEDFEFILIEEDEQYKKYLAVFEAFMYALAIMVFICSGLFIASIFGSFLQKYRYDMMLIRVMGGSIGQVKKLFMILGAYIVGIGCIGGCVLSFITGNILFKLFAGRFNLVKEAQDVSLILDLFVCFVTFFVIMLFLYISVNGFTKKLPLHSVKYGEAGKVYSGKGIISRIMSFILRSDNLICYKMTVPQVRLNILLVCTITVITAIVYMSNGILQTIVKSNTDYYMKLYLDNIMIDVETDSMTYDDIVEFEKLVEERSYIDICPVYDSAYKSTYELENGTICSVSITDFDYPAIADMVQGDYSDAEFPLILNSDTLEENGLNDVSIGDTIKLNNLQDNLTGRVVGIERFSTIYGDALVDRKNYSDFSQNDSFVVRYFVKDMNDETENVLQELRHDYPTLSWQSFDEIMDFSDKVMSERYVMVTVVLYLLCGLTGIGWYNSSCNMLNENKIKYTTLRKLGMSYKRVKKLIWKQILMYVLIGIILGTFLGISIITLLDYREYGYVNARFELKNLLVVLGYFGVLVLMHIPKVHKAAEL